jgi:hypothetical protein
LIYVNIHTKPLLGAHDQNPVWISWLQTMNYTNQKQVSIMLLNIPNKSTNIVDGFHIFLS